MADVPRAADRALFQRAECRGGVMQPETQKPFVQFEAAALLRRFGRLALRGRNDKRTQGSYVGKRRYGNTCLRSSERGIQDHGRSGLLRAFFGGGRDHFEVTQPLTALSPFLEQRNQRTDGIT